MSNVAIFNSTVDATAKNGLKAAGRILHGAGRNSTKVFNEVGQALAHEAESFEKSHPGQRAKLIVKLAPAGRTKREATPANA